MQPRMETNREKYNLLRIVSRGSLGRLVLMEDPHKKIFAVKQISKSSLDKKPEEAELFKQQLQCMKTVKGPHLAPMLLYLEDSYSHYMFFEYFPEGSLQDRQEKKEDKKIYDLPEAIEIMVEVIKGLQELHISGYLHRNLKVRNILFKRDPKFPARVSFYSQNKYFYLADYSYGGKSKDLKTIYGHTRYTAPEYYETEETTLGYGIDMWALGVTLFYMLNGEYPFSKSPFIYSLNLSDYDMQNPPPKLWTEFNYPNAVEKTQLRMTYNCTADINDLFSKIFQRDPAKRLNFHQIKLQSIFRRQFEKEAQLLKISHNLYEKPFVQRAQMLNSLFNIPQQNNSLIIPILPEHGLHGFINEDREFRYEAERNDLLMESQQRFVNNYKFLSENIRHALRFSVVKLFIIYSRNLLQQWKRKELPKDADQKGFWTDYFESTTYTKNISSLQQKLKKAQQIYDEEYQSCKNLLDSIEDKIPGFKVVFSKEIKETEFDGPFKTVYRRCTATAYKYVDILISKSEKTNKLTYIEELYLMIIYIFVCHSINRMFTKEDIPVLFRLYFEWRSKNNKEIVFEFAGFKEWLRVETKQNLRETVSMIIEHYFRRGSTNSNLPEESVPSATPPEPV